MNEYENDSFESSSSTASRSLVSNEEVSKKETFFDKWTEERHSEVENRTEVADEKKNSSATSESDSLNEEHKWAAVEAHGRPEFKQLSTFVAFGSMSATSPEHSQRTSEYEEEEKQELEEELREHQSSWKMQQKRLQIEQTNNHNNNDNTNANVNNKHTSNENAYNMVENSSKSLETSAASVHREVTLPPKSDVEFSFLSTLEEHLEAVSNKHDLVNISESVSPKKNTDHVDDDVEAVVVDADDENKKMTLVEHTHRQEEQEKFNVRPMQNQTEEEEEEEQEKEVENNVSAIKTETERRTESPSISPVVNERRIMNLSKSVSFRLPSLPLPENLHTLENSGSVNNGDGTHNDYYKNDIKLNTIKQEEEHSQIKPLTLQAIEESHYKNREEELRDQKLNESASAVRCNNYQDNVREEYTAFVSTPSPLPSAKFNFVGAKSHRADNVQQKLQEERDNNGNSSNRMSSSYPNQNYYHPHHQHRSRKLNITHVNKNDERLLSKAKTLQETSLAVERLVQSLATLRAYNKLQPMSTHAQPEKANTKICTFRQNKTEVKDKVNSVVEEAVLELVLRMLQQERPSREMMHRNESLHSASRRECHELITAESFFDNSQYKWYNTKDNTDDYHNCANTTSSPQHKLYQQRHEPTSVSCEYSQHFIHDYETLYKTVIDSVTKYVFKRVDLFAHNEHMPKERSNTRQQSNKLTNATSLQNFNLAFPPTVSASFCTLLLMDLVLLCKEIADTRLAAFDSLSSRLNNAYEPILIKYCGQPYDDDKCIVSERIDPSSTKMKYNIDSNDNNNTNNNNNNLNTDVSSIGQRVSRYSLEREFVTTLIHCLPFEIVHSTLQMQQEQEWEEQKQLNIICESTSLHHKQARKVGSDKNDLIFRLEYWVGFEQMQVIVNALLTCTRNLLSNCIQQNQYFPLDINVNGMSHRRMENNWLCNSSVERVIDPPTQRHPYFVLITRSEKMRNSTHAFEPDDHVREECKQKEVEITENIYRFPSYINSLETNMHKGNQNQKASEARSRNINTFGLESITLQKLVLTLSKMTTEMMSANDAKRSHQEQQKELKQELTILTRETEQENAKRVNRLVTGMSAEEQYTLFSSCVMEVVTEHIKDVSTVAAIRERVNKKYLKRLLKINEEKNNKDNYSKVIDLLRKKEKALIQKSEIEAADVLEQIVQEINVFNASHKK